ncbi:uncharacterized protein TRAVEDRAFT_50175 [Trametes versicolor FP-101664 SS1]|uniref:uncharacterized protein n=1 Tax=Trametes versicolor (strain FP-101664) TaxID=717944 RepID=UPI0004621B1F|nr:uncharacterized protein TRAVEDRAFT_50175 [Trametes versicolor FP-101664 SS1]EIW55685.1 hypothetical protein TRAVEDRAFT_50175 [Trametes versicolor FP-101664 SS1]
MWLAVRTACVASLALSFLPAALVRASFADPPPPPVLSPKSGDVWTVGEVMTVRWSMDDIPFFEGDNKTPFPGTIYLGHLTDSDAGFALWSQEPLADNVPLLNKEVAVEVPNVPSGRNYFIMWNWGRAVLDLGIHFPGHNRELHAAVDFVGTHLFYLGGCIGKRVDSNVRIWRPIHIVHGFLFGRDDLWQ